MGVSMKKLRAKLVPARNKKQLLAVFTTLAILFTSIGSSNAATFISQSSSTETSIGNVSFAPKSSRLSAKSKAQLDKVVAANPGVSQYKVVGYSQWAPWANEKSYQKISSARANSVKAYLQQKGVTVAIVTESGGLPKTNNKSYKSRRAEIYSVTRALASPTPTDSATPTPTPTPTQSTPASGCRSKVSVVQSMEVLVSDQCTDVTATVLDDDGTFYLVFSDPSSTTVNQQIKIPFEMSKLTLPAGIKFKLNLTATYLTVTSNSSANVGGLVNTTINYSIPGNSVNTLTLVSSNSLQVSGAIFTQNYPE